MSIMLLLCELLFAVSALDRPSVISGFGIGTNCIYSWRIGRRAASGTGRVSTYGKMNKCCYSKW